MVPGIHRSWSAVLLALGLVVLIGLTAVNAAGAEMPEHANDPLATLHAVELGWIERIQSLTGLAGVMRVVSDLGPGRYMILVLAGVLFCANPRLAFRMTLLMFLALWLREVLAQWLQSPRPYWFGPPITTWGKVAANRHTFGLPSGHAMVGAAIWIFAAAECRRRWAWGVAIGVIAAIAFSRLYLGVHFVSDVVLGVSLGLATTWIWRRGEPALADYWLAAPPWKRWGLGLGTGLGMAMIGAASCLYLGQSVPATGWEGYVRSALNPETTVAQGGAVTGILVGVAMLGKWSMPRGPWWARVIRLGIAGAVLRWGIEPAGDHLLDSLEGGTFGPGRFSLVFVVAAAKAWSVWWFFPWLYLRLGHAEARGWHAAAGGGERDGGRTTRD